MIDVRLSEYTVDVNDPIVVSVSGHEGIHRTTQIGVVVADLADVDNAWTVKTILPARVSDGMVQTTLHRAGSLQPDKMREIRVLELQGSEGTIATLVGGRDFPRTFFRTRAHAAEPSMTYDEVVSAAGEVEKKRETQLAVPLGDLRDPEAAEFRVLMFVERLLLTNYMRVPGIELLPLSSGNPATDEAKIVNTVLAELGWNAGVDPSWWADKNSRERPILLVRIARSSRLRTRKRCCWLTSEGIGCSTSWPSSGDHPAYRSLPLCRNSWMPKVASMHKRAFIQRANLTPATW